MNLDDALEAVRPDPIEPPAPAIPKDCQSGADDDGVGITVTTGPIDSTEPTEAVWRELAADWSGLNPTDFEIVGPVTYKGWDSPVKGTTTGETIRLRSYTARLVRRHGRDHADIAALCKQASRRKPTKKASTVTDEPRAFMVWLADWQVGKGEGGGSAATVDRIVASFERTVARIRELKRLKRPPSMIYVIGLGDLLEQCDGHYPGQAFTTDLTRREQAQVVRRLALHLIDELLAFGLPIVLSGIAGNHGENRRDGKEFTTPEDNDDLALLDQCSAVFAANPARYSGVSVKIPDQLSAAFDVCGTVVGFTHGHKAGKGATPAAKLADWWKGQIVGGLPTAHAKILVSGHYHHLNISEALGRTHMQAPAMDGGSRWFSDSTGMTSPAGLLTFAAGEACGPRGWDDLAVL